MYHGPICLGLTPQSTNEEIKKAAFDFVLGIGYMSFATTNSLDGAPGNRALAVHSLDDEGGLYVGASSGKHFCKEVDMEHLSRVCAVAVDTVAVRISARLRAVGHEERMDQRIYDRFWRQNPGTLKMYAKDTSNFQLFEFAYGNGEVFHAYEDDKIARVRFAFGGGAVAPWAYTVRGEKCIGCGECVKNCMMQVIRLSGHKAQIEHYGCNECGICHESCAYEAIDANGF